MKYNYIIYHKNCFDGFSSLCIFMNTNNLSKDYIIYPDIPSSNIIPPSIKGKNVIIMDVAYKNELLKKIVKLSNFVLFIDHHVSIIEDVKTLTDKKLRVNYNSSKSAAILVWEFFNKNKKYPKFIEYINKNDIGKWDDETYYFISSLEVNFKLIPTIDNIKKWNKLFNDSFVKDMINNGKIYNEYKNHLINKHSKRYDMKIFPSKKIQSDYRLGNKKFNIAVINNYCPSTSLVGKKIVDNVKCDFCLLYTFNLKKNIIIISLRSKNTNVGDIAKKMGGGGHKLASAFTIDLNKYNITDLFDN
jgi:uncharacterized protein